MWWPDIFLSWNISCWNFGVSSWETKTDKIPLNATRKIYTDTYCAAFWDGKGPNFTTLIFPASDGYGPAYHNTFSGLPRCLLKTSTNRKMFMFRYICEEGMKQRLGSSGRQLKLTPSSVTNFVVLRLNSLPRVGRFMPQSPQRRIRQFVGRLSQGACV